MIQTYAQFNPLEVSNSSSLFSLFALLPFLMMALHVIVAIGCWIGIREACERVVGRGGRLQILGPGTWALAGLLGSVITVAIFWVMHESTLIRRRE